MTQPEILPALQAAFASGHIELEGQFTLGSNYTFLVQVTHNETSYPAVYKPIRGEQPLWDFPEETLCLREVAAYEVSRFLGWGLVPYTILAPDGPYGPGSLQLFIEYNPNYHYFNFKPEDRARLRPVALFDHLTNNADRKGSHVFFEKGTRHLYAIDHGLCFHVEDKLRSVIWDFAGQPIDENLCADLQRLSDALAAPEDLPAVLQALLHLEEIAALAQRAAELLRGGVFPLPPEYRRAYPYPPL